MSTIFVIIAAIVAALLVLDILFVDWMTRYACDSTCPDMPQNIAQGLIGKKAKAVNPHSPSRIRAEKLRSLATERVEITNREGMRLVGHWYRCPDPERIILAGHGWRSSWDYDFNGPYEFLHDLHCSVLFIEQRCHGESEGRYYYHGKKERFDYADWIAFLLRTEPEELPVYIYGLSMGAAAAIMSTTASMEGEDSSLCKGSKLPCRVKGVIADSAYTSARDTGEQTISNIGLSPKFFYSQVRIDYRLRLKMADNAYTTEDALRENDRIPILFISGTKDKIATEEMQRRLFALCRTPKMQLLVEGVGHMKSYYMATEAYQQKVKEFLAMVENIRDS